MKRFIMIIAFALLIMPSKQAAADSVLTSGLVDSAIIAASAAGGPLTWLGAGAEALAILAEASKERDQQKKAGLKAVGGLFMNNSSPTFISQNPTVNLTFAWVDPSTNATTTGPATNSIAYYEWAGGPITLSGTSIDLASWALLGTSSNAASDYSLATIVPSGTEALFLDVPLDSNGNTIVIDGVAGLNDAETFAADFNPVPEPTTVLLLSIGLAGLAGYAKSQRKTKT